MSSLGAAVADYYYLFIVLDILLVFSLIGYFIDQKNKQKIEAENETLDTIKLEAEENIEELKVQMGDKANSSLSDALNKTGQINVESVEEAETLLKEDNSEKSTFQK